MTIDPTHLSVAQFHRHLLGAVIPRPIALASTIDRQGQVNLSPFSFFNCFGTNPPILIFAPSFRVRDNTSKHTHDNVLEVPETVIHIVHYDLAHQMSLASAEYPRHVNEFVKAGCTPRPAELVKPPIVDEAPIAFECAVQQVLPTGEEGGAGVLIICKILLMHIKDHILDDSGQIDPFKLDAIGRLGGEWYTRVNGDAIFSLPKPKALGIGFDQLPVDVLHSRILTGNELAMLASVPSLPGQTIANPNADRESVHRLAKAHLARGDVDSAWKVLLA